jgi:hypothetical protein
VTPTGNTSSDGGSGSDRRRERRAEGRVRAIYATIILTAVLVGLRGHTESAGDVIEILVGAALMLFIAHTFSDFLARRVEIEGAVPLEEFRELLIVESPLLIAAGIPVIVFVLAQADVINLEAAFWISLSYSVASLFVIGAMAASRRGIVWGVRRRRRLRNAWRGDHRSGGIDSLTIVNAANGCPDSPS